MIKRSPENMLSCLEMRCKVGSLLPEGTCFCSIQVMSQAFVKESEEQWLHEMAPTMNALIVYLTRKIMAFASMKKSAHTDPKTGKEVHVMSNGLHYSKDRDGRWAIV